MVARTPGAIGAATLTSTIVGQLPLNRLSLDGVEGTPVALARGTYPLSKRMIFVTTARTPPAALAIIAFACSGQGRAVAAKAGVLVTGCGDPVR
jgi:phosphate transport system substrate-binding protein